MDRVNSRERCFLRHGGGGGGGGGSGGKGVSMVWMKKVKMRHFKHQT